MKVNQSGRHWSKAVLHIALALTVITTVPGTSFAQTAPPPPPPTPPKNVYAFGPGITGPIGRVMEQTSVWTFFYGWTNVNNVNASTNPSVPMGPIYTTMTFTNPYGNTYSYMSYSHHQHFYTPSITPGVSHFGEASASYWWNWVPSTLK